MAGGRRVRYCCVLLKNCEQFWAARESTIGWVVGHGKASRTPRVFAHSRVPPSIRTRTLPVFLLSVTLTDHNTAVFVHTLRVRGAVLRCRLGPCARSEAPQRALSAIAIALAWGRGHKIRSLLGGAGVRIEQSKNVRGRNRPRSSIEHPARHRGPRSCA